MRPRAKTSPGNFPESVFHHSMIIAIISYSSSEALPQVAYFHQAVITSFTTPKRAPRKVKMAVTIFGSG